MSNIDLINDGWVDIVFEGKNQTYGAYQLRKETGKRNVYSILMMLAIGVIIAVIVAVKGVVENAMKQDVAIETDVELSKLAQKKEAKVERKEPVKVEVEQKVVEKVKSSVKFTAPEIKKDELVNEENQVKDQADLDEKVAVGVKDQEGTKDRTDVAIRNDIAVNTNESEEKKEVAQKIFDVVEQQPQFPGNLNQYLRDHINYPTIAQENGIQGKVIVQFVVERDGSITQVNVIRGVDPSLDKEAVRVVKSMPKWTPGRQNGQAVRVKFTLPVNFKLG
jgi:protein TonB